MAKQDFSRSMDREGIRFLPDGVLKRALAVFTT